MTEMLQYIRQANQAFWGGSIYHLWFYAAVLLIICLEKSSETKRTIGVFPLCFIVSLYIPVAYYLVRAYTSGGWGYFARLYSMIPLPVTLGLGTVLLIDLVCTKAVKRGAGRIGPRNNSSGDRQGSAVLRVLLTGCFCGVMILGGTSVYEQDWFRPAQNMENVPDDAIGICRELHQDEGVTIAVPDALSRYIRQIDASFYMPYGRYVDALGYELSRTNPDPEYVMNQAGKEACDYIVVYNNTENFHGFQAFGWVPVSVQGEYLIYRVQGVCRTINQYNSSRQLMMQTLLDETDKPVKSRQGYHTVRYQYDRDGLIQCECYYDTEGTLIGQTGKGAGKDSNLMKYYHSTDGVYEDGSERISFTTDTSGNRFNLIGFQLFTADKVKCLMNFGEGNTKGETAGEYLHEMPDGMYYLRMKANSNRADEYIESLIFLQRGDRIEYGYRIDEFDPDMIVVRNLSAYVR